MSKYLEIKFDSTSVYLEVLRETPLYYIISEQPNLNIKAVFNLKVPKYAGLVRIHKTDKTKRESLVLISVLVSKPNKPDINIYS